MQRWKQARKPQYPGITQCTRKVHVNADVINGISAMHVENGGKERRFTARDLAVYAKSGDEWRLIARQSTRQPEA